MGRGTSSWWSKLKEQLGLSRIGCCGSLWGAGEFSSTRTMLAEAEEDYELARPPEEEEVEQVVDQTTDFRCSEMNLAAALAAERQLRAARQCVEGTPTRASLIRLLQEGEGEERTAGRMEEEEEERAVEEWCCVCMGRRKGAALIPCGHTFCRACSRELWLHRRSCPLCNRPILEILDIF